MWQAGIGSTARANPWIKRAPEGLSLLNKTDASLNLNPSLSLNSMHNQLLSPKRCQRRQCFFFLPLTSFNSRVTVTRRALHGDAAAVAFTHAATVVFNREKNKWWEMQSVYHDRLQMSFLWPAHSAVQMVPAGRRGRRKKYNWDKKKVCVCVWGGGMKVPPGPSHPFFSFSLGPLVVCNWHGRNWFPDESCDVPPQSWRGNNLSPFASRDTFRPLPRRAALIAHFSIPDSSCGLFTSQPSLQSAEQYLSIKAADLLIDKKESDVRKEQIWELLEEKKRRAILKGKGIWIISLSLSWQQPWIVHLRIINHCLVNTFQVLSIWVNANTVFFSFLVSFRRKTALRRYTTSSL